MGNNVFANGRELACKSGQGKVIAAFPDVCFTPPDKVPPTPPGVPIPYPLTSMASDTNDGTKSVIISKKEVMLRDSSNFKKCMGDDAAQTAKKGMISSKITGKVFFTSWSMDIKIQKKNAVRHLDTMTSNHSSPNANAPFPWPFFDQMTKEQKEKCKGDVDKEKDACKDYKPYKEDGDDACKVAGLLGHVEKDADWASKKSKSAKGNDCIKARRCRLVPYSKKKDGVNGCCPAQTPDHLIPKSSFYKTSVSAKKKLTGWKNYSPSGAPCMCTEGGTNTHGSHGLRHTHHKMNGPKPGTPQSLSDQADLAADGAMIVFPGSNCNKECIKAQLEAGHKKMKSKGAKDPDVKHSPSGSDMTDAELDTAISNMAPSPPLGGNV